MKIVLQHLPPSSTTRKKPFTPPPPMVPSPTSSRTAHRWEVKSHGGDVKDPACVGTAIPYNYVTNRAKDARVCIRLSFAANLVGCCLLGLAHAAIICTSNVALPCVDAYVTCTDRHTWLYIHTICICAGAIASRQPCHYGGSNVNINVTPSDHFSTISTLALTKCLQNDTLLMTSCQRIISILTTDYCQCV